MKVQDMTERRIQYRPDSYVLTIPMEIVKSMKIKKGQAMRLGIMDGKIVIVSSDTDLVEVNLSGPGKYEAALDAMLEKASKDTGKSRGKFVHPKVSKLEKLRIK